MRVLLLMMMAIFITACSDEQNKVEEHVWKEQTDMIDKAKDVEQMLKDSAALQQQRINEQTH